ncbi:MAG: hypothetical protein JRI25_18900 [Deltaproteobacteria bacterium]|nr:hypothetical protein [Deltaproteobacteria bacterium]
MARRLAILLLLGALSCGPKKPPPVVITSTEDLTEKHLNALVHELAPLVEEAAGKRFEEVPHARLGRLADLQTILEDEFLLIMGRMYDVPDYVLRELAERSRASAPGVVGKFGVQTRVLYLSPEAVGAVTMGAGLAPERAGDVARLVMAHEMAHALQAQEEGLDVLHSGVRDMEQLNGEAGPAGGHDSAESQPGVGRRGSCRPRILRALGHLWAGDALRGAPLRGGGHGSGVGPPARPATLHHHALSTRDLRSRPARPGGLLRRHGGG